MMMGLPSGRADAREFNGSAGDRRISAIQASVIARDRHSE
jgi:hypothetical protein